MPEIHQRRGAADRGEYRQAAGPSAFVIRSMAPWGLAPMGKIRALLGGALLLVAGTCFAEEWPDKYSAFAGPYAEKEFAALTENGRAAYKTALIACSLFVDEPSNAKLKQDCKAAIAAFALEFNKPF